MTNDSDDVAQAGTAAAKNKTMVMTPLSEDAVDPEEYARLLAMYEGSFRNISEGEVIKGTILKVSSTEVIVDVLDPTNTPGVVMPCTSGNAETA